MAFGQKTGSIKNLKKTLKGGGAGFIKYVPKDGSLTIRFITDPDEWLMYRECFDEATNKGYPVPDDEDAPGYPEPGQRVSKRYLANAVMVDEDKVVPLQMPVSLVNQLVVLYEKYGTVTDRDFELMRSGTGLETSYQAVPEAPMKRKIDKYKPMDLEEVLEAAYNAVWGDDPNLAVDDDDDEDDDEEDTVAVRRPVGSKKKAPAKKAAAKKKAPARKVVEEIEDDDEEEDFDDDEPDVDDIDDDVEDDDDEDIDDLADDDDDEDEDDEEDEDESEDDEDEDFYTEDDLKKMGLPELRALAREYGVKTTGMKKPQIIAALLDEGDDEEPF